MAKEYEDYNEGEHYNRSKDSIREIQEMEQIEKGLQDFLKQELSDMDSNAARENQPQTFDLKADSRRENVTWVPKKTLKVPEWDNDEDGEYIEDDKELDESEEENVKSSSNKYNSRKNYDRKRYAGDDYEEETDEDWDNAISHSRGKANQNSTGKRKSGIKKHRRKKSRFRKFIVKLVIIVLILAALQYYFVGVVYNKMNYKKIDTLASEPLKDEGVINILLIGNDSRENGEDGRSDAMILLSINSGTKKIYMTSLLRDIYVDIPGHDGNRLNAAYSFGGAELLMETIEQNFDIEVNRYVLVNFEAFANLVDAVGGVDLELSSAEVEYVNGYLWEYNILTERPEGTDYMDTSLSGLVHLNGPQALAYSRNRYIGTDFGRTERQRKVLSAVIKKLPKAVVTNPRELMEGLMPNLTTNLTQAEVYRMSFLAAGILGYDIEQSSIPLEGTYNDATIRGMAVLEVDFDANKQYIQENIYGDGK
jgi:LCP family protein required for cell wall assembly